MNRQILKFETNQPVTVALEFPDGVNLPGHYGPQVKFSLTDNRVMYVAPDVAQAIKQLGVLPGQPFCITKRWEKGRKAWWDIAKVKTAGAALGAVPVPAPPVSPAEPLTIEPTSPEAAKTPVLPASPPRIQPQPASITREAAPPPSRGIQLTRTPPAKPSYEEAFRECLRIVTDGLNEAGGQWNDGARQDMVATLMIQLGRSNSLGAFQPRQTAKVA